MAGQPVVHVGMWSLPICLLLLVHVVLIVSFRRGKGGEPCLMKLPHPIPGKRSHPLMNTARTAWGTLGPAEAFFFLGVAVKDFPRRGCKDFL